MFSGVPSESCVQPKKESTPKKYAKIDGVPYNIHDVDRTLVLARELVEISGLAYDITKTSLLAVNDELGNIYELDKESGKILSKNKFADLGDYEGLEIIDGQVVVTRSNGKLYFYDQQSKDNTKIVKTNLSTSNNIEGITFMPDNNFILLACKGLPRLPGKFTETKGKAIYSLDLDTHLLSDEPYLYFKDKHLKKAVKSIYANLDLTENQIEKLENRVESFAPSGLAVHPISGELYILSAKRSLLLVVGKDKLIKHIHFLDEDAHVQPEGICFAPDGEMYISNESKKGYAKIHVYNYQL